MNNDFSKVSIIMGIFNCDNTLAESIKSILNQTYKNWELIMCDDGSSDDTYKIAKKYAAQYPNIFLIKNESNKKLAYTLNHCLQHASGEFIARQDGDDRSTPDRLEKEVKFLLSHPEYAIVGSCVTLFDESGKWGHLVYTEQPQPIDFTYKTQFSHPTCLIRRDALMSVNGYNVQTYTERIEDYDLWFRMYAKGYRGYNIPERLYEFREDQNAILRRRRKFRYVYQAAYVRFKGYRMLQLPVWTYIWVLRPFFVFCVPKKIYASIRKFMYRIKSV
jgi:glycosyltransferase EpsE